MMKRIYHPYNLWEDWKAGMFDCSRINENTIRAAVGLLRSEKGLYDAMKFVAWNWPFAAAVNLSNHGRNRQAWLGQASCCHKVDANESETKMAWRGLADAERWAANNIADAVIQEWEKRQCQRNQLELTF